MNKPPAFQFYPSDWLSSTKIALMTPAEEGAYIRLLCHAWADSQCSLPNDDAILASLSRLGEGWSKQSGERIKGCFKVKGNRLINERLKNEREKQKKWREKSRLGGINSGKSRKGKELQPKGGSNLLQTKDEPKGNTSVFSLQSSSSSSKDNTMLRSFEMCAEVLMSIPGYPFDPKTDLAFLQEKETDYPDIDILLLLKGWRDYLLDKPLKKNSNARSQLANQFTLAIKWDKHQKHGGGDNGSQLNELNSSQAEIKAAMRERQHG